MKNTVYCPLVVMLVIALQANILHAVYQESGGVLSMEAENGTIGTRWLIEIDTEASNSEYIEIDSAYNHIGTTPDCTDLECIAVYDFSVTTNGNYKFWFRMLSDNGSDDSFFWRIDDGNWNMENNRFGIGSWFSSNDARVDSLSAGSHILEISYREDGTQLDKFVIQLDSLADPSGEGPVESGSVPVKDPSVPENITAVLSGTQIELSWSVSSGADSYKVKRSTGSGGPYSVIVSNINTTSYRDIEVATGVKYYYVVSAVNSFGESQDSDEVFITFTTPVTFKVDFSLSDSNLQTGYELYLASHEQAPTFTTQSYSVFGSIVGITPTWADDVIPATMQMIDRGQRAYEDSTEDLIRDWIGTDTRSLGDPLTLTISGLPEGDYSWLSYHHDTNASIMGKFDVTVIDAIGSVTTSNVQITGTNDGLTIDDVAKFTTFITSNGVDDIILVFEQQPYTDQYNEAWFIMNGFEIISTYISPCFNAEPIIENSEILTLEAERANLIDIVVSDDGKPYIEGCNPEDPQPGTSYPLEYQWSQISGPGTVVFDPASADQSDTTMVFPQEGLYEILVEVSDAPESDLDRKTAQSIITVDVIHSPCFNEMPEIEDVGTLLILAGRKTIIEVNASDDGKPYVEDCDPDDPRPGTSYPLEYEWSQLSGPGTIIFDPLSADQLDTSVIFPLQGIYEILLEVSDGPESEHSRKKSQQVVTVDVVDPVDGDINFDGFVNILDFEYFAEQWLLPCSSQTNYCADFNNSGQVSLPDFALLTSNWMKDNASIVINEFVASNKLQYADGDGNYPDWIELYNQSTEVVSLSGWYLTDDEDDLRKWEFPSQAYLTPGEYMIVFASGSETNNYIDQGGYLHTNFALDKDGEYLALISPFGDIIYEYVPEYPEQRSDISYGLWYGMERYFITPTPMGPNSNDFFGFTDKPDFNYKRGFYDQPFDLEISSDIPESFIKYTTDGSEPTEQHGYLYDQNVPININTTSVIRAAVFKPGYLAGDVKTATYIFINDVVHQPVNPAGWPDNWGSEPQQYSGPAIPEIFADYEMDPRVVNNTLPGYSIQEALMDIPSVSIAMEPDEFIGPEDGHGLWANPLITTEYKCSIEYIPVDGSDDFQEDCKVENHGYSSRFPQRMQKHNLRLTFTSEYGASKLKHPIFPDSPVDTFNQLILRAFSSDSWALVSWMESRYRPNDSQYTRDVWMKNSLRDMGQPSSYGSYVHVYVNGLYFGLFDMTESVDEAFCAEHYGGEREDWTVGKDFSGVPEYWDTLLATDVTTLTGYEQSQNYIDIENFADYMLLHFYADVDDWPHHNGIVINNTVNGDGRMRFLVWDQAIVLDSHGKGSGKIDDNRGVGALFQKMRTSEEFRMLFADRVYKHCFNDGALSIVGSQNRYLEIANMIDKAIVAESARWGDTQMSTSYGDSIEQPDPLDDIDHIFYPPALNEPNYYFTRESSWLVERDNIIDNYIPAIHNTNNSYAIINVFRSKNLYPDLDPPLFDVNGVLQPGGYANTGELLSLVNPNGYGDIYYTTDGSDPRLPGGGISASATLYSGPSAMTLLKSVQIKTRIQDGSEWSALSEALFAVGPVLDSLRITEIMYHPAATDPNTEFIEMQNIGAVPINLNMVKFTKGVDFTFDDVLLAPGEYAVIVEDVSAFAAKHGSGLNVVGQYEGSLSNGGERVKFKDAAGTEIQDFDYKDSWYELTDGNGFTLTMFNPASVDPDLWDSKDGWRSSLIAGGTPGAMPQTTLATDSIVINEVLAHSHATNPDWIELYNTTGQNINIGGWFLSDDDSDQSTIRKYEISAGTSIDAYGYKVFQQDTSFGDSANPGCHTPFGLSEGGETVYMYSGQNGEVTGYYQVQQKFDASESDVTFGRYEKTELSGGYDFVRQASNTKGYANTGPLVPDIVITEIYYNPADGSSYEFVELYNRTGSGITLESVVATETSPGNIINEIIAWRLEGTGFEFPAGVTIGPYEYIIVAKDPTEYSSVGCDVYGPYDGKLDNGGEEIALQVPGDQEYGKDRYWIPIEKVDYDDKSPWPASADGEGDSLNRKYIDQYSRDYSNWTAEAADPGR